MIIRFVFTVINNNTILKILTMVLIIRTSFDLQNAFKKQVLGVVVLTDYNNNTYRVDDVDFAVTPSSTFKKKDGSEISYKDYYQTKYQIKIQDMYQPMLVSKSKPRDRRAGQAELVYLVPELCRSTGAYYFLVT